MVQTQEATPAATILSSGRAKAAKKAIGTIPQAPGCYVFRDAADAVLYVGKSVSLRHRLTSYFAAKPEPKVRAMMRHAQALEWHTVGSEVEALILESQLIKRFRPPYNVLGQEYPHYTFLHLVDVGGFPYLEVASSVDSDGSSYYGPFWGKRSAEQTLEFVTRLFSLRRCSGALPPPSEGASCFYAQVRRCSAPCLNRITSSDYAASIRSAGELLRGDIAQLIARLEHERDAAAEALRFERAAELQQTIKTLRSLQSKRRHLRSATNLLNFLVVVRERGKDGAQVMAFSAARLRGQVTVDGRIEAEQRAALERFVLDHFPVKRQLTIDLDELDQMHVVAEWMARHGRYAVHVPLPDGPLTPVDASRAAEAIAEVVGRQ
ncbi:MAG: GIY-YIG nuclease family protein [Chloroflexi bacterium]|nr:GIY-YIG nuclease family protein [Chloroflexota bacterium]